MINYLVHNRINNSTNICYQIRNILSLLTKSIFFLNYRKIITFHTDLSYYYSALASLPPPALADTLLGALLPLLPLVLIQRPLYRLVHHAAAVDVIEFVHAACGLGGGGTGRLGA